MQRNYTQLISKVQNNAWRGCALEDIYVDSMHWFTYRSYG
jgi:hypothetical protein